MILSLLNPVRVGPALFAAFLIFCVQCSAQVLPEFEYRDVTVIVKQADGKPVASASIYGFSPDLNLLWPRIDKYPGSDVLWHQSSLGKTGVDGSFKAKLPAGKWGFFAGSRLPDGAVLAVWSEFAPISPGKVILLAPAARKQWALSSFEHEALAARQMFFRASGFPAFVPIPGPAASELIRAQLSKGRFELWASGEAKDKQPAFVLSWGTLSDQTPDGPIAVPTKPSVVESSSGTATLSWFHLGDHGVEGTMSLASRQKAWFSPGQFILSYQRSIAAGYTADFVGQLYRLDQTQHLTLTFDGPLATGVDQHFLEPDQKGRIKLNARLYFVDRNGHVMKNLLTPAGKPAPLAAAVWVDGKRVAARPHKRGDVGQTSFYTDIGTNQPTTRPVWELAAVVGVFPQIRFLDSPDRRTTVSSATFKVELPKVLESRAEDFLSQMEYLARYMNTVAGRPRRTTPTLLRVEAGKGGASATHSGKYIRFGAGMWYFEQPTLRHSVAHELGHNYGFYHGGLHETIVELSRAGSGPQIGQQDVKWLFFDRMNGMRQNEKVGYEGSYPNIGLYLYCYSQKGEAFTRYLIANEYAVQKKLKAAGYSDAEITTALCTIAMKQDIGAICRAYGLAADPAKVAAAVRMAPAIK
ncbi:MAG: hypothetical protein H0X66_10635 [Verrucomicrobia bacterium]|nr:hypothetical protein [Verrucomicrobiota bacterium]